ncbi:MAG: hypothetical protein B6D61_13330 [Bacteroidetes bacterium 4484_249]|nr:MAG: hypothetical protein B6D61_13330 [Bacteroidetes bacterium 4484_249]
MKNFMIKLLTIVSVITIETCYVNYSYGQLQLNEEWVARYDGNSIGEDDHANDIAIDNDGYIYVIGGSTWQYGYSCILIKYDPISGNKMWEQSLGGFYYNNKPKDIAVDGSGIYITGESTYFSDEADIFTVKYDLNGNLIWEKYYGNSKREAAYGIAVCGDHVYVTGESDEGSVFENFDILTICYRSSDGYKIWETTYDNGSNNYSTSIDVDDYCNVYVTGGSYEPGNGYDFITIRFNASDGFMKWEKRYDGTGILNNFDFGRDIIVKDGYVYVTGESYGSLTNYDYVTIKYSFALGTEMWPDVARYNGPVNDEDKPKAITVDNNGNTYVTGTSYKNLQ